MVRLDGTLRGEGLAVVAVHEPVDGGKRATLAPSASSFGMRFPVLLGDDPVWDDYGINGIPTRILLDRQGRVISREVGFEEGQAAELERRVREALAGAGREGTDGR